jgi:glyoxylase-like metal-dependent hydrolase (beta-lactamase superfamily II)
MTPAPIDLRHQQPGIVGCYLLETEDGPALFDCGPASCVEHLRSGLRAHGLELTDVRHLLLSHIHLDHAGAAGVLVREHPALQVHVSEVGAPHLVDPSKLEASARRLYGDAFDALWGELAPVPAENVHVVGDRVLGLDCFPTTGHAWHHVSFLDADGLLYAGDAAGVRLEDASFVMPPLPPPEIDLEAWERTIEEIERRAPGALALIHFGVHDDVEPHLAALRETLRRWGERVEDGMDEETSRSGTPTSSTSTSARGRTGTTSAASSATGASGGKRSRDARGARRPRRLPALDSGRRGGRWCGRLALSGGA